MEVEDVIDVAEAETYRGSNRNGGHGEALERGNAYIEVAGGLSHRQEWSWGLGHQLRDDAVGRGCDDFIVDIGFNHGFYFRCLMSPCR